MLTKVICQRFRVTDDKVSYRIKPAEQEAQSGFGFIADDAAVEQRLSREHQLVFVSVE